MSTGRDGRAVEGLVRPKRGERSTVREGVREVLGIRERQVRGNGGRGVRDWRLEQGCGGSCGLFSCDCVIDSKTGSVEEGPPNEPITGETRPVTRYAEASDYVGEIDKEKYVDGQLVGEH